MADFLFENHGKESEMNTPGFEQNAPPKELRRREGELYRIIEAHGKTFEIYYGYYDEADRQNPLVEPMEMYPNFVQTPVYTEKGIPFAVAMQPPCKHFKGEADVDNTCYQCTYYERCEELLGLCTCPHNRKEKI